MMFQFRENRSRRGFTSHIGVNVITFARASHNRLNFIFYFNSKKTAAAVVVVAVEIIVVKSVAGNLNPLIQATCQALPRWLQTQNRYYSSCVVGSRCYSDTLQLHT
jgi:hypothetical protein